MKKAALKKINLALSALRVVLGLGTFLAGNTVVHAQTMDMNNITILNFSNVQPQPLQTPRLKNILADLNDITPSSGGDDVGANPEDEPS